jgi:hypothetical protein
MGVRVRTEGKAVVWETVEGFDSERLALEFVKRSRAASEVSQQIVARLLAILSTVNPLHLVGQVAAWATTGLPDIDDARERFGVEAQVEFLGGLALSLKELAAEPAGPFEVQSCINLLGDLFEAEQALILGEEIAAQQSSALRSHLDEVRLMARLEQLMDRTQGYAPHLEQIIGAVFEPIRAECLSSLSFCPADLPRIVRAHIASRQRIFQSRLNQCWEVPKSHLKKLHVPEGWALMSWVIFGLVNPEGDTSTHELADAVGLPESEVGAALEALTSKWGCQPGFRAPGETNQFRRYPVLKGSGDRYSVPLAWSALHEIFGWFREELSSRGLQSILKRFHEVRAEATETLITETFRRIFGSDRVYSNVEYPIPGKNWAEVDALVWLGDHALVIEGKGHALSDAFRAGEVDYARMHFADVVDRAFSQSERAARYLAEGGKKLRHKSGGPSIEWMPVSNASRIAVSFERIDPLVLVAARLAEEQRSAPPTWVVCLADLLMVAEILPEPHEFYAYAALRAELASNPVVALVSEADVLGAFLHDRLEFFRGLLKKSGVKSVMLDHHSGPLNAYFSSTAAGLPAQRPVLQVPEHVVETLRGLYSQKASDWPRRVRELITVST